MLIPELFEFRLDIKHPRKLSNHTQPASFCNCASYRLMMPSFRKLLATEASARPFYAAALESGFRTSVGPGIESDSTERKRAKFALFACLSPARSSGEKKH